MFCPSCGIEDRQANQFCRACGADLGRVRTAVASPDSITASAVSARDEIGRAVAAKIRETRSASELSTVAEEVLPQIEKFLESPQQKRLRRMRTGMILACVGLGTAIGISLVSMAMTDKDVIFLAALGAVTFFIGLAFILNGVFLTVPRTEVHDRSSEAAGQAELDNMFAAPELAQPAGFTSVTEDTTKHLKEKHRKGN
ncbi:hypothetical protein BH20ACI2_BH20ACI2_13050 [soil metagenome]